MINYFPPLQPLVVQRSGYMITVCERSSAVQGRKDVFVFDLSATWCDVNTRASPQVLFLHIHS